MLSSATLVKDGAYVIIDYNVRLLRCLVAHSQPPLTCILVHISPYFFSNGSMPAWQARCIIPNQGLQDYSSLPYKNEMTHEQEMPSISAHS